MFDKISPTIRDRFSKSDINPTVTLEQALRCLAELDRGDSTSRLPAIDRLRTLAYWLDQGGKPPTIDRDLRLLLG